jgi:uncharacterized oxidoreductase
MTFDLKNSTALITGGARGIGLELSEQLIGHGCNVVAVGRNTRDLKSLQLRYPENVKTIAADLSLPDDVDRLIARVIADHPTINILINNAGIQTEMDFFSGDAAALTLLARKEIAVNMDGPIALTLGLLPVLWSYQHAAVVNIGTGLAIAPKAASPVYCATKAAMRSFTKALRYQCKDQAPHVHISEAIMTLVDTDMTRGRGRGKISAKQAAAEVIAGLRAGRDDIWIAKAKLLPLLNRVSPGLVERMMR